MSSSIGSHDFVRQNWENAKRSTFGGIGIQSLALSDAPWLYADALADSDAAIRARMLTGGGGATTAMDNTQAFRGSQSWRWTTLATLNSQFTAYRSFPVPPRCVYSMQVCFNVGNISAEEYGWNLRLRAEYSPAAQTAHYWMPEVQITNVTDNLHNTIGAVALGGSVTTISPNLAINQMGDYANYWHTFRLTVDATGATPDNGGALKYRQVNLDGVNYDASAVPVNRSAFSSEGLDFAFIQPMFIFQTTTAAAKHVNWADFIVQLGE